MDKPSLRAALRTSRRAITGPAASAAAQAAAERLIATRAWQRARAIGLYLPGDGEISTLDLMQAAWQAGKRVYLPVIRPPAGAAGRRATRRAGHLIFRRYRPGEPLRPGILGVPEPLRTRGPRLPLGRLDLLVMPLVGFDSAGNRLGMGGGFYDRSLAGRSRSRRPRLMGLAYSVQKRRQLPADPWDIRLDAAITDTEILFW